MRQLFSREPQVGTWANYREGWMFMMKIAFAIQYGWAIRQLLSHFSTYTHDANRRSPSDYNWSMHN
jgi:hypothetical protein